MPLTKLSLLRAPPLPLDAQQPGNGAVEDRARPVPQSLQSWGPGHSPTMRNGVPLMPRRKGAEPVTGDLVNALRDDRP